MTVSDCRLSIKQVAYTIAVNICQSDVGSRSNATLENPILRHEIPTVLVVNWTEIKPTSYTSIFRIDDNVVGHSVSGSIVRQLVNNDGEGVSRRLTRRDQRTAPWHPERFLLQ